MRRAGPCVCAALAALVIAGCGGSSAPTPHKGVKHKTAAHHLAPGPVSAAVIAKAAQLSAAKPGYAVTMKLSVMSTQLEGQASANGQGNFDAGGGSVQLTLELPGLLAILNPLKTTVILSGSTLYAQVPPSIRKQVPKARPWLSLTLAGAGHLLGISPSVLGSSLTPHAALEALAADSTGQATYVGSGQVDGATADEYRLAVPQLGRHDAEVWVDPSTGLLSQVAVQYGAQRGATQAEVRVTFTGYGEQSIEAPPASSQIGSPSGLLNALGL